MRNTKQESKVDSAPSTHTHTGRHYIDGLDRAEERERVVETRRKFNDVILNTGDRMCAFAMVGVAVSHWVDWWPIKQCFILISFTVDSTTMGKLLPSRDAKKNSCWRFRSVPVWMTQMKRDADGVQWSHSVVTKNENTFSIPITTSTADHFS